MENHGVTLRVELEPSGSASVNAVQIRADVDFKKELSIRASIDWVYAGAYAYLEEDPKDKVAFENNIATDLAVWLLAKAVAEQVNISESDIKTIDKVFSQYQEVFTGENILFLVEFSRVFPETVVAAETYLAKVIDKPINELSILVELFGILIEKPLPVDYVYMEDLMGFLHERDWYESVTVEPVGDYVNALQINQATINNRFGGDLIGWSLERPIQTSIDEPVDAYDRIVQFVRDYYSSVLMVDNADFNSGDGLEYSFAKTLTDAPSIIENIVVGLLYEKYYEEVIKTDVSGDLVGGGLLGQYAVNQSIGGEQLSFEFLKTLVDSFDQSDIYDRVVQFYRDFYSDVTMVDTADFNSGDGLEYAFLKSLYDAHSVEDQIVVGLLYEKAYFDSANTEIRGDLLNDGLLGQYTINQSIGGEHLQLGFIKSLVDACEATDAYDRVIDWQRAFDSNNVSMVDTADFNSGDGLEYQFVKGLLDTPIITEEISAGLALIRSYSDTINANPEDVPINAQVINLFTLNNSPGGDRFSYIMTSPIPPDTLNGPFINQVVMNGNFTP